MPTFGHDPEWQVSQSASETAVVVDRTPGAGSSTISEVRAGAGQVFWVGTDSYGGRMLYARDATLGTIRGRYGDCRPAELTLVGAACFFAASSYANTYDNQSGARQPRPSSTNPLNSQPLHRARGHRQDPRPPRSALGAHVGHSRTPATLPGRWRHDRAVNRHTPHST